MKKAIILAAGAAIALAAAGCKTVITDVSSNDTGKTRLMTTNLTFADIENAVGSLIYGGNDGGGVPAGQGMLDSAPIKEITNGGQKPVLVMGKVTDNSNSLGLNTGEIRTSIMQKLIESQKFVVMDKAARSDLSQEIRDQQMEGLTKADEQKKFGAFRGADFTINGTIREEQNSLNGETVKVLKLELTLNSLKDGNVVWIKNVIAKQTVVNR